MLWRSVKAHMQLTRVPVLLYYFLVLACFILLITQIEALPLQTECDSILAE